MAKTCPITRTVFANKAPANLPCTIGGQPINAMPKTFSTGSIGFYANGKVTLNIGGVLVQCQVGLNITVVGSKELPQDASVPSSDAALEAALNTPEVLAIRKAMKAKAEAEAAEAVANMKPGDGLAILDAMASRPDHLKPYVENIDANGKLHATAQHS